MKYRAAGEWRMLRGRVGLREQSPEAWAKKRQRKQKGESDRGLEEGQVKFEAVNGGEVRGFDCAAKCTQFGREQAQI